jgi:methylthioribose-1-phosphate isomerase
LIEPIAWTSTNRVRFLDQTRLPQEEVWMETAEPDVVAEAIRSLRVRGAPLIGIAAAYGIAAVALNSRAPLKDALLAEIWDAAGKLRETRPTAVNLSWAIDRMLNRLATVTDVLTIKAALEEEAIAIHREDVAACERIGALGAELLRPGTTLLTHCNAGALATGGYGTALGVVRSAWSAGKLSGVIATETRPLLQGARLTAWELASDGIPVRLIADGAAGHVMSRGEIGGVVVGADRIAANGDTANKIGTYQLAVLAREHGIPFYVAAPLSTIDLESASGDGIPIEERPEDEVRSVRGVTVAADVPARNPAFDVTPARFISAIITNRGVATAPYPEGLPALFRAEAVAHG